MTASLQAFFLNYHHKFSHLIPLLYVFLSGIGFSIQGLIIKVLVGYGFHGTFHLIFLRGFVQLIFSSTAIFLGEKNGEKTKLFGDGVKVKLLLFARAFLGFFSTGLCFLAVEMLPLGDANVLTMQAPVFAAIFSAIIIGEPWYCVELSSTILSLIGVILVAKPPFLFNYIIPGEENENSFSLLGVLCGLGGAISAGGAYTTIRILGTSSFL